MRLNKNPHRSKVGLRKVKSNAGRLSNRDVFSYHNVRSVSDSKVGRGEQPDVSVSRRRTRFNWRIWPTLIAGMVLIISIGYMLTLSTLPRIITNNQDNMPLLRPIEDYEKAASGILRGSVLNRNKVTIDVAGFNSAMKQQFPEIEQADLTVPLVEQRPVLKLSFSKPVIKLSTIKSGTYLLDANGRALLREVKNESKSDLPLVVDESGLSIEVGKGVLTKQTIDFITTVNHQLSSQNHKVESMSLPPNAHRLHVKIADKPYHLKFNTLTDAKIASGSAIALIKKLDADHITPSQYIDLRVEEKVYYL